MNDELLFVVPKLPIYKPASSLLKYFLRFLESAAYT
jgi:hypothetical protein